MDGANEQDIYKSYANIKVFLDSDELLKEKYNYYKQYEF